MKVNSFPDPKKDAFGFGIFRIGHLADKWKFYLLQMTQLRFALQFSLTWPLLLQRKQKISSFLAHLALVAGDQGQPPVDWAQPC
jgi:hypothetical protein